MAFPNPLILSMRLGIPSTIPQKLVRDGIGLSHIDTVGSLANRGIHSCLSAAEWNACRLPGEFARKRHATNTKVGLCRVDSGTLEFNWQVLYGLFPPEDDHEHDAKDEPAMMATSLRAATAQINAWIAEH